MSNGHNHEEDLDFISPLELIKTEQRSLIHSPYEGLQIKELIQKPLSRRKMLTAIGSLSAVSLLAACSPTALSNAVGTTSGTNTGTGSGSCAVIPSETKGPYPLDGSNGTNALPSIYRSNIIGSDINTTAGVPLTVNLSVVSVSGSCSPIANAAVYIWHCDQYGQYSGYSSAQNGSHAGKTFCRGIVVTDSNGLASFTTVYPGWYAGRITHIHIGVYLNNNLSSATKISQLAFPQEVTTAVYQTSPYSSKGQNSSVNGFAADNIFSDGVTQQLSVVTGSVAQGLVASLVVGV